MNQSEQSFRHIIDEIGIGALVMTADYRIVYANKAITDITGYKNEELNNFRLREMVEPTYLKQNNHLFKKVISGELENYRTDVKLIRKDGEVYYGLIETNIVRDRNRNIQNILGTLIDITDRKEFENEVRMQHINQEKLALYSFNLLSFPVKRNIIRFILEELQSATGATVAVYSDYMDDKKALKTSEIVSNKKTVE